MEQGQAAEDPPRVAEERLVRSDLRVQPADVIEEAKVVVDLEDQNGYRGSKRIEVDPPDPPADTRTE